MKSLTISFAVALLATAGCRNEEKHAAPAPVAAPGDSASVQQALDRMDTRAPVPLLPMMANHQKQNMRDHLVAVQEIVGGLASDDFGAIERAASRIGYSEQMSAMCSHMGAGAPGFTDQAVAFHKTADTIADAARSKDRDAVVRALGATLGTCTGCHAMWKQRIVDERTWSQITAGTPGAPHGISP
ncbi:cytochrome c [Sorangium sp. So ce1036]|uniref:cytochrome c n=1 Tax=Sorangium sp. So ce1036 TaxID=3133328 RepID=UPI003EFFA211